jgi:hypothetical protein
VQKIVDHHRFKNIQLKVSLATAKRDRYVIPIHLDHHHRHRLALSWIHFAGHDRGTRLVLRDGKFPNPAEALVESLSAHISNCAPGVTKVSLATAKSLAGLAFQFGYKLVEGSFEMDESEHGSGMQSLLMFETLHLMIATIFRVLAGSRPRFGLSKNLNLR